MKRQIRLLFNQVYLERVQNLIGPCSGPRISFGSENLLSPPTLRSQSCSSTINDRRKMQYHLPRLDKVEDVEKYRIGGFHPTHIADTLKDGRYHILHKLGYGGFATVWLARDEHLQRLVSLKILIADAPQRTKEFEMLQYLDQRAQGNPRRSSIISILDTFTFQGPNGTHACYVS